jgi:hypothetical protein
MMFCFLRVLQSQITSHYSTGGGGKTLSMPSPQSLMFLPFLEQLRGMPPAATMPSLSPAAMGKSAANSLSANVSTK